MKKIMTVLAAAGILMLGITGQAQAKDDGGHSTCTQNGGRNASCHLYHIKLEGSHHCVDFTMTKQTVELPSISVCRKNSMNVYLDPGVVSSVTLNIDGAGDDDGIKADNYQNWCFRLTQGTRYVESILPGVTIKRHYDKLQTASQGDHCNAS
jgi:hypothetical protein